MNDVVLGLREAQKTTYYYLLTYYALPLAVIDAIKSKSAIYL